MASGAPPPWRYRQTSRAMTAMASSGSGSPELIAIMRCMPEIMRDDEFWDQIASKYRQS
jgi:hypothetical protein